MLLEVHHRRVCASLREAIAGRRRKPLDEHAEGRVAWVPPPPPSRGNGSAPGSVPAWGGTQDFDAATTVTGVVVAGRKG